LFHFSLIADEEEEIRKQTFLRKSDLEVGLRSLPRGQLFAPEVHTPQGHQEPEYILDKEQ
jgi:hypothetical protein